MNGEVYTQYTVCSETATVVNSVDVYVPRSEYAAFDAYKQEQEAAHGRYDFVFQLKEVVSRKPRGMQLWSE